MRCAQIVESTFLRQCNRLRLTLREKPCIKSALSGRATLRGRGMAHRVKILEDNRIAFFDRESRWTEGKSLN